MTNDETAQLLDLSTAAASNRYIRALRRLKDILSTIPGFDDPSRTWAMLRLRRGSKRDAARICHKSLVGKRAR
jgi:hypothetical protein